jgi:hypothetical protein
VNVSGLDFNTDVDCVVLQRGSDDGGDAPSRTGDLFFFIGVTGPKGGLRYAVEDYQLSLDELAVPGNPGDYYRYPSQPQYKVASDFSRDQRMQMVLAMGALGLSSSIKESASADLRRFSRTPNGDLIAPWDWAMYLRSLYAAGWWQIALLWPLLVLCDVGQVVNNLLVSLLLARAPGKAATWLSSKFGMYFLVQQYPSSSAPNNPDAWSVYGKANVGNDVLAVLYMLASRRWLPTPTSWIARKLYAWLRPTYEVPYVEFDVASHSYITTRVCDRTNGATYAFDLYFIPSSNANPFNDLYRSMLAKEIR